MITVYFDGICSYCAKEINYYKKISDHKRFKWIDVAKDPNALIKYNITQSEALLFLHAIDESNEIFVGAEAFAVIWKNLPKWRLLGHLISLPLIKNLTATAYRWFAKRRFKSYQHCQLASNELPDTMSDK